MSNHLISFYVRTLRLADPAAEVVPVAAQGIWELLDDQERLELLACRCCDQMTTPPDEGFVNGTAFVRLSEYGLANRYGGREVPLVTPVGQAVAEWAEKTKPASCLP